jgi:hypothetical protein
MLPEEVTAMVRLNELGLGTKRMIARELQMQPDDGETLSRGWRVDLIPKTSAG